MLPPRPVINVVHSVFEKEIQKSQHIYTYEKIPME